MAPVLVEDPTTYARLPTQDLEPPQTLQLPLGTRHLPALLLKSLLKPSATAVASVQTHLGPHSLPTPTLTRYPGKS